MSSIHNFKVAELIEQAHCGLENVIILPINFKNIVWPPTTAVCDFTSPESIGFNAFDYWRRTIQYNDEEGNTIECDDQALLSFLVGLLGRGIQLSELSSSHVVKMYGSNNVKIAETREQAQRGSGGVKTTPRVQVDRSGYHLGPVSLVYPKKEKISWFERKAFATNKVIVHDTSKRYEWIKPKRPAGQYVVQQYVPRPVQERHVYNPNVNKGIKGPKLPSNPLPPSKPYVERPPPDHTSDLRDAFWGEEDDDPEIQAEKTFKYERREFLKSKPVAQMDTKLPKIHRRTLTPVLGANSLRHKLGSITHLNPLPPSYEKATLYPNLEVELPVQSASVKYDAALQELKKLSIDEETADLDELREGKEYRPRPKSVVSYKPAFEGWCLRVNKNSPPKMLRADKTWNPLPFVYAEIPTCSYTKFFNILKRSQYDFSHYYDLIRNKGYSFERVCAFVDLYILVDVLKRTDFVFELTSPEFLALCIEVPRALIAACDEIKFFYHHKFGAPLIVSLEDYHPVAQVDPAVFVPENEPPPSTTSFISAMRELPGNINVAARQVSDAAQAIPRVVDRVNDVLDRAALAVDDVGAKWNEALKCAEFVRLLFDAKIQYDYVLSNSCVPIAVKIFKTLDLGLRVFAAYRPGINFSEVINVLAMNSEGDITHTHNVLVQPVAQNGGMMCVAHIISLLYECFEPSKGSYAYLFLDYCKRFNVFATTLSKSEYCFKTLIEWLGKVLEVISYWTGTNSLLAWYNAISGRTVDRFVDKATTYLQTLEDDVGSDPALDAVLTDLCAQRKEIERLIAINGWTPQLARMRGIFKELDERHQLYEMRKEDIDGRLTPYCICIFGPSQIGKSQLLTTFADQLLTDVPLGMRVYARGQSEFYDGYNGQQSIIVDDWAARADSDFGELLDWITCNKTVLPMASLDNRAIGSKGSLLKAKLVLLATNTPYPNISVQMLNPEAVYARRHLLIECIKTKDFVLDDPKFSHLAFRLHDPVVSSRPASKIMDYDQLMEHVSKGYAKHMEVQVRLQEHRRARRLLVIPQAQAIGPQLAYGLACTVSGAAAVHTVSSLAQAGYCALNGISMTKWLGAAFIGMFCMYLGHKAVPKYAMYQELDVFFSRHKISPLKQKRIAGVLSGADEDTVPKSAFDKGIALLANVDMKNLAQVCAFFQQYRLKDEMRTLTNELFKRYELHLYGLGEEVSSERYDAQMPKTVKPPLAAEKYDSGLPKTVKSKPVAEATEDTAALDLVTNMIRSRMCKITVWNDKGEANGTVNGIVVRGTQVLTVKHVFYDTTQAEMTARGTVQAKFGVETATWFQPPQTYQIKFSDENVVYGKHDYCLIDFAGVMNQWKDITHHFIMDADLPLLSEFDAQVVTKSPHFSAIETVIKPLSYPTTYTIGPGEMRLVTGWEYRANTTSGDCGAPLIAYKSSLPRKIVGLHVCAFTHSSRAYGELMTQERLKEMFVPVAQSGVEYEHLDLQESFFYHPELVSLGRVAPNRAMHQPTKTKLTPSVFAGFFGCEKQPSVLSNTDPRGIGTENILFKNFMKYAKPCYGYSDKTMSEVADALYQHIRCVDVAYVRKILDKHETVNGYDHLSRLDPHTSAGYPYCLPAYKGSTPGKLAYMKFDPLTDTYSVDDFIWDRVEEREILACQSRIGNSIWTACLKDELLSPDKIANKKTRVFVTAPLDFTLAVRKYFGAFSSWVMKNGFALGIAAGFNPESMKWSEMYHALRSKGGERVGELDYTEFDSTISPCLANAFVNIVNRWYGGTPGENTIRRVLVHEMMHTNVLLEKEVVRKHHGNPSGNPLTTIFNSFSSIMLLMMYFRRAAHIDYADYSFFFKKAAYFVCGDDNIFSFEADYCTGERLDDSIRQIAQELGMTVTDATKGGDTFLKSIRCATFLKRGFRIEHNIAYPTLSLKSINAMIEWVNESKYSTVRESSETNAETALRYLYFHGKEVFDEYRRKLLDVASAQGIEIHLPVYSFYDDIFREEHELNICSSWC